MPFTIANFLLGRVVAENAGVDSARANQLALLSSGIINVPLPVGLVMTRTIAQNEAPAATPPATTPSPGTGLVEVPDVRGEDVKVATDELTQRGFTVVVQQWQSDKPDGMVIEQSPTPPVALASGNTVTLYVSSNAPAPVDLVKVIDVVGAPADEAEKQLRGDGLNVRLLYDPQSNKPHNTVVDQDPEPGSYIAPGNTVWLIVSAQPIEIE